ALAEADRGWGIAGREETTKSDDEHAQRHRVANQEAPGGAAAADLPTGLRSPASPCVEPDPTRVPQVHVQPPRRIRRPTLPPRRLRRTRGRAPSPGRVGSGDDGRLDS